jgi:hypothetical protein
MHPPPNPNQQREEFIRKEQARREDAARRELEERLTEFDAHSFYQSLETWIHKPIPRPIPYSVRLTPLRQKVILYQPMPITRKELSKMRRLSASCALLISLLRAVEQRGLECPYIHQINKKSLEKALEKCRHLSEARGRYFRRRGFWARVSQLVNRPHLGSTKRDVEVFTNRLEALLMICRHEEFAQDLMRLRQAVTSRAELSQGYNTSN